jgi:hypothetical protein
VHNNSHLLFENGSKDLVHKTPSALEDTYKDIFTKNRIVAVTVCFRKDLLQYADLDQFESRGFRTIDLPLWLEFSQHASLAYIDQPLATFRFTEKSISNNRSILEYYSEKYPVPGLDQRFILEKFNLKMYYSILYYGTFDDLRILSKEYLPLTRFKLLALKSKCLFQFYKGLVKLFYKRV